MNYLTDRKRAEGLGAGGAGTHHHWQMMVSSILLVFLVPAFVITFGLGLGGWGWGWGWCLRSSPASRWWLASSI